MASQLPLLFKTMEQNNRRDIGQDITGRNLKLNNLVCTGARRYRMTKRLNMLFAVVTYFFFLLRFGLQLVRRNMRGCGEVPFSSGRRCFTGSCAVPFKHASFLRVGRFPISQSAVCFFTIGMTVYIVIAISYEEKDFVGYFGDDDEQYKRDVGRLIPVLGKRG